MTLNIHVPDICPTIHSLITILIIRFYHSSWASPSGVRLLGGNGNLTSSLWTSEMILEDGTSVSSFPLEYDLEYYEVGCVHFH